MTKVCVELSGFIHTTD